MTSAEARVQHALPDLPPDAVIHAVRSGASVQAVINLSAIHGPAMERAKRHLRAIRKELLESETDGPTCDAESALADLATARRSHIRQQHNSELQNLIRDNAATKSQILELYRLRLVDITRLNDLNTRIHGARSTSMGISQLPALIRQHDQKVSQLRGTYMKLINLVDHIYSLYAAINNVADRLLYSDSVPVQEIRAAGGLPRTDRSIYRHTQTMKRSALLESESKQATLDILAALRPGHEADAYLRQMIAADLEVLKRTPGHTSIPLGAGDPSL